MPLAVFSVSRSRFSFPTISLGISRISSPNSILPPCHPRCHHFISIRDEGDVMIKIFFVHLSPVQLPPSPTSNVLSTFLPLLLYWDNTGGSEDQIEFSAKEKLWEKKLFRRSLTSKGSPPFVPDCLHLKFLSTF